MFFSKRQQFSFVSRSLSPFVTLTGKQSKNFSTSNLTNDIDYKKLVIEEAKVLKPKIAKEKLAFGRYFTDYMLEIDWDTKNGWNMPKIRPYGPFQLDPACTVFHYALETFEGLKAYLDIDNNIRLFRPNKNVERLLNSCQSLCFPKFNGGEFLECLFDLLNLEKQWIPKENGYSLYIRPTVISTTPIIGVAPPTSAKLFVILSPVGPYYAKDFCAVKLLADDEYTRAWPKGSGDKKLGSNYAGTIKYQMKAEAQGYSQVMWLLGEEHYVTEVGTMNQFFFWINENNEKELITAPLDGTILPGVTRDSILHLTREWNEFKVTERRYTMKEVIKAIDEKRVLEAFGSGTAAIVCPIQEIGYRDKSYPIPLNPNDPKTQSGPLAKRIFNTILDIQYGRVKHPWSMIVPEKKLALQK